MLWIIHLLWILASLLVALATLCSTLPWKFWWMRIWDFPRLQVLIAGLLVLAASPVLGLDESPIGRAWIVIIPLLILSIIQQCRWAFRLTPMVSPEVPSSTRADTDAIRVIAANVDYTNTQRAEAIASLLEQDPDLLALVEVDGQWDEHIRACSGQYPHRITEFLDDGRGVALLSKHAFRHAEVRYLVQDDRPSIWAHIKPTQFQPAQSAEHTIGVCVLHPPPPGLKERDKDERVSSVPRDIELKIAALMVADSTIEHWIMVGDFNDVGWSRTTEQAKSIGNLFDPRIGRGMFNTFPAKRPLLRYPIDHVLVTGSFCVARLLRLEDIGSDHLPLLAELTLEAPTP